MEIFKSRSYKQNIKSKSRQSETLVIQKSDFFELVNSMINDSDKADNISLVFSDEESREIEQCV